MKDKSDTLLIKSYLNGCDRSFEEIYHRYQIKLNFFIKNMLKQPSLVEDVAQKTWMKIIRGIKSYRDEQFFYAWVLRIARNCIIDEIRHLHYNKKKLDSITKVCIFEKKHSDENIVEYRELVGLLKEGLLSLPKEQREVFLLRQQGVPFKDIAKIQEVSLNTALSRMHYAMGKLNALLQKST